MSERVHPRSYRAGADTIKDLYKSDLESLRQIRKGIREIKVILKDSKLSDETRLYAIMQIVEGMK